MSSTSGHLHFANAKDTQLANARACNRGHRVGRIAGRGKMPGTFRKVRTFQRAAAGRGASPLPFRARLDRAMDRDLNQTNASRLQGSLAGSLDYGLSKQPAQPDDMFTTTAFGGATIENS
jgi:hypothetical protein